MKTLEREKLNKESKQKSIYFLCNGFPTISETFIISQITNAIENGFKVNIHSDFINNVDKPLLDNDPLIKEMLTKTYTSCPIPEAKLQRLCTALSLARNKSSLNALVRSVNLFRAGFTG